MTSFGGQGALQMAISATGLQGDVRLDADASGVGAAVSGSADLTLRNFRPQGALFQVPPEHNPQAHITWTDLGDDDTLQVEFVDDQDWFCFYAYQFLAYDDLIELLEGASSFLQSAATENAATSTLPFVNGTLTGFAGFADEFAQIVDALPPGTSEVANDWEANLRNAFAAVGGSIDLTFDCPTILVDVAFNPLTSYSKSTPLRLSSPDFGLASAGIDGDLNVNAQTTLQFQLGIDVNDPANPRFFLTTENDGARLEGTFRAQGSISGRASIGEDKLPLGVWVNGGSATIDLDGAANSFQPARFAVVAQDVDGTNDGRHYFEAGLPGADWSLEGQGARADCRCTFHRIHSAGRHP